ncbi:MAG: hypothetical protein IPN95_20845 [Bacteroidetes bacterium]|nr:hypothetical protein [Bacteroidota bacterium]
MRTMKRGWSILLLLLALMACNREKEVVVPDNEAPPDSTVADVVLERYINSSYIILLGQQPDESEMAQAKVILRAHNVSQADRNAFLDLVMAQPAYPMRMFDVSRAVLLNGSDTTDVRDELFLVNLILADSAFVSVWDIAQVQKAQLLGILAIPADLAAGTLDIRGMHKRLVFNRLYDQINMGTQNFVVSMFQNFLARYPTDGERAASELMVDGFSSQIFLVSGRTKAEFVDIFMASGDYDEGQVRDLFMRYLYRNPTTEEMESLSIQYHNNNDYKALQKAIMSSDQFLGI